MSTRAAAIVASTEAEMFKSGGRNLYLRAPEEAENPRASEVFLSSAEDGKDHVRRVMEICEELKDKPCWPHTSAVVARHCETLDVFDEVGGTTRGTQSTAGDALRTASHRDRVGKARCDAETGFHARRVQEGETPLGVSEKAPGDPS